MADVKQIEVNGVTYDIHDAVARADIANLQQSVNLINEQFTLYPNNNLINMFFAINSNGLPYLRWVLSNKQYQVIFGTSNISLQLKEGDGAWTNVWTK